MPESPAASDDEPARWRAALEKIGNVGEFHKGRGPMHNCDCLAHVTAREALLTKNERFHVMRNTLRREAEEPHDHP